MLTRTGLDNRFIIRSLAICVLGLFVGISVAQTSVDVVTDIPLADVGVFEWSADSSLFTFIDRTRIVTPTEASSPTFPDAVWQAFAIDTQTLQSPSRLWPLQPNVVLQNFPEAVPDQFLYASPDRNLFVYIRQGEPLNLPTVTDAADIAIANAATGESLSLNIPTRIDFSPESEAEVYWAATNRALVLSTTSAGVGVAEPLRIYHVQLDSPAPLDGLVRELNASVDGVSYDTRSTGDRLLALSPDGQSVLLIATPNRLVPQATSQPSQLVLWRPNTPQASQVITALDAAAICQAAFAPDAPTRVVATLQDGRIAVYDPVVGSVQFLVGQLEPGCPTNFFSPDGRWLAVPYNSLGRVGFQNIAQRIAETTTPMLQPPIANAGGDVVLTDPDGDGRAPLILDGTRSSDPDGDLLTYVWSIGTNPLRENGAIVELDDLSREEVGEGLPFTLTVTDEDGLIGRASINVTFETVVTTPTPTPTATSTDTAVATLTETPTATFTETATPTFTETPSNTPVPPTFTNTPSNTPVTTTLTHTYTPVPPTPRPTATYTSVPPTPRPPTATWTPSRTPTRTSIPPTATPRPGAGWIVYTSNRSGNYEIYATNTSTGYTVRLTNNPARDQQPIWSPDRTRIAFVSDRAGSNDIWVLEVANPNNVTRVPIGNTETNGVTNWNDIRPAWSPDGTKLAFQSNRDGDNDIYYIGINSVGQTYGALVNVTRNSNSDTYPSWNHNSNRLAFVSDRDGNLEIYKVNLADGVQTRLTSHARNDYQPSWSPDGSYIAFVSERNTDDDSEVYYMNPDGTGVTRVTNNLIADSFPNWSANSTASSFAIVFMRSDGGETNFVQYSNTSTIGSVSYANSTSYEEDPDW